MALVDDLLETGNVALVCLAGMMSNESNQVVDGRNNEIENIYIQLIGIDP